MKIVQIISFYFGPRRIMQKSYQEDYTYFLKKHLQNIDSVSTSIKDYVFVFNSNHPCYLPEEAAYPSSIAYAQKHIDPNNKVLKGPLKGADAVKLTDGWRKSEKNGANKGKDLDILHAIEFIKQHSKDKDYNIKTIVRANKDMSYGAWEEALNQVSKQYDYSLLLEDDYICPVDDYEKKFLDYFDEPDVFYVATEMYKEDIEKREGTPSHPSMSCGMINNKIYNKYRKFNLMRTYFTTYHDGCWNQEHYLDPWREEFKCKDISDKYRTPFLDKRGNTMISNDDESKDLLITPIYPPFIKE